MTAEPQRSASDASRAGSSDLAAPAGRLRTVELGGWEEANRWLAAEGWTDGLPVVPPTPDLVAEMAAAVDRPPGESLGLLPPAWAPVTVEKVAVDAVMAGCPPSAFGVVLAAVEAVLDPAFRVQSVQTSTSPATPVVFVGGPAAVAAGVASGTGSFGPGPWPNLAIGRAVRLVLANVGGGRPGAADPATLGWPVKVGACLAERTDRSPWPALHERRGAPAGGSGLTVAAVTGMWQISEPGTLVDDVVHQVVHSMATLGHCAQPRLPQPSELFLVVSPGIAGLLAERFASVAELRVALFERARIPADWVPPSKRSATLDRLGELGIDVVGDRIPIAEGPECFEVVVAGGDAGVQSFGMSTSVLSRSVSRSL